MVTEMVQLNSRERNKDTFVPHWHPVCITYRIEKANREPPKCYKSSAAHTDTRPVIDPAL